MKCVQQVASTIFIYALKPASSLAAASTINEKNSKTSGFCPAINPILPDCDNPLLSHAEAGSMVLSYNTGHHIYSAASFFLT
jgi:hypothetical protein